MLNSLLFSIFKDFQDDIKPFVNTPAVKQWRNHLLDALKTPDVEAILAFGQFARSAVDEWPGAKSFKNDDRVFFLTHPTAKFGVLSNWNQHLAPIAAKVSLDPDGVRNLAPYTGSDFQESDLVRIPRRDLGFGATKWMGTGDMAAQLNPDRALPPAALQNPTILWSATGKIG